MARENIPAAPWDWDSQDRLIARGRIVLAPLFPKLGNPGAAAYLGTSGPDGAVRVTEAPELRELLRQAPVLLETLIEALAWYWDEVYDGAEDSTQPDWYVEAFEEVGLILCPNDDLYERTMAVREALKEVVER